MPRYSQLKAMFALIKASLKSTAKSPSSILFTIAFPLVFIFGFDFLGNQQHQKVVVAIEESIAPPWKSGLLHSELMDVRFLSELDDIQSSMEKGEIMAILTTTEDAREVIIEKSPKMKEEINQIKLVLANIYLAHLHPNDRIVITEKEAPLTSFNQVDFILPGQLGFSLLAASIFGTAFVFFNLRSELVLKRFFASPIKRQYILLAEAISRMFFQVLGALAIILIGHWFLGFHLKHGFWTVFQMLLLSGFALLVFMSFGFIISGVANSSAVIPPLSNIIVLPQFILADTFIPIEQFPGWLETISRLLPLTNVNMAFRKIAFDGLALWDVGFELSIVLVWGLLGYTAAVKLFKWE